MSIRASSCRCTGGNTEEIGQLLFDEKISVGLIEGPARHREVRSEHFMEDEMVFIARADLDPTASRPIHCFPRRFSCASRVLGPAA